jgi:diguanylate cyclase (GGDEF)-like protein
MRRLWRTLLSALLPRVEPDEKPYRMQLARWAVRVALVLLAAWLVIEILILLVLRPYASHGWRFDLAAIGVLGVMVLSADRLVRQGRTTPVGYLLASGFFVYTLANAFLIPQDIYLVNVAFLLSIVAAGAMVGGGPAYLFAALTTAANLVTWLYARGTPAAAVHGFDPATGAVFLMANTIVAVALAAVLSFYSSYMRRSISALNEQAEQMTELAHTDPMTGLANRRWLMEQLGREFSRARRYRRPLSLLYLDLDGFKAINDRFGHLFGDEVLTGAGRAMKAVLRSTDLLARIGGDEFVVLLPETAIEGAHNVTAKLRKALTSYGQQLGPAVPVLSFCAGVSQLHADDTTIDDILSRADEAQYLAKGTGPGHTRSERELVSAPPTPPHGFQQQPREPSA